MIQINNTKKAFIYRNYNLILWRETRAKNPSVSVGLSLFVGIFRVINSRPRFEQEMHHLYHFLPQLFFRSKKKPSSEKKPIMREETMQCLKPLIKHLKHFKNQAQELDSADRVALSRSEIHKKHQQYFPVLEFLMDFKAMKVKREQTLRFCCLYQGQRCLAQ